MAARFNCLRCGRRLNRTAAATSTENGSTWVGEPRSYYEDVNLCPRCAERHAARTRLWSIGWAVLVFAGGPAAVVAINALR